MFAKDNRGVAEAEANHLTRPHRAHGGEDRTSGGGSAEPGLGAWLHRYSAVGAENQKNLKPARFLDDQPTSLLPPHLAAWGMIRVWGGFQLAAREPNPTCNRGGGI